MLATATALDRPASRGSSTLARAAIGSILLALGLFLAHLALAAPASAAEVGSMVFVSDEGGDQEIWTMNADGSNRTQLTDNGAQDAFPAWSPDGARIAFASDRDGDLEIYTMLADGSNPTKLTDNGAGVSDWYPTWSPDGARIAFTSNRDGNDEIYSMLANGSAQTRLTNNGAGDHDQHPDWSPDGARIAFTSFRDGNWEIYSMSAAGTGPTRLTGNGVNDSWPDWSPDGARIAFVSQRDGGNNEIYSMLADGSAQTRLTSNVGEDLQPSWSPDGARIAFASTRDTNWNIYKMNLDGSDEKRVTDDPAADFDPDWSVSAVQTAEDIAGNLIPPPIGVPSDECTTPSATVIDGYFGSLFARLKVQDEGAEKWVCTRLQSEGDTELAGGKLVVGGADSVVDNDDQFGACSGQTDNVIPTDHPIRSGQIGDPNDPPFVPYLLDAYANQSGTAWVCLRASLGARVIVNGGAGTSVFRQDDPVLAVSPPRTPWTVGKASTDCETRLGGTKTQFVNAKIAGTQVWLDTWQSPSIAQLCVRAQGSSTAGERLTIDATGSPGVTPVLTQGNDATPCTTTVFTDDQDELFVRRSPTGANPASVCVTKGTQTIRVTAGFTGTAGPPDVAFAQDS